MAEKVRILTNEQETPAFRPEKYRIQTALPIQSGNLKPVRIRKKKVANEGIPKKDILP